MKIEVIGCGSAFSKISNTSSLLVTDNTGNQLLIDCGPTVPRALYNRSTSVNEIGAIYFTHIHPDHCTGLTALFNYWKSHHRTEPVTIFCQEENKSSLQFLALFANWPAKELCFEVHWQMITDHFVWNHWQLETAETQHELTNRAVRISADGQQLFYSGDGRPTQASIDLMQHTDLAFQECASFDALDETSSHCDFYACKVLLEKSNIKRLGLYHCWDEAIAEIKQSAATIEYLFVSHDGLTIDLSE
ncbi:MBL fold metallo-hydrolase [Photobacterium ganghwense]|uniref:MBL fold metallo-hydrolase n=1 Tax=Photobacterium ganghwense TaxID=320778 RepID=UPI001C2D02B7|nr:MBL fold metallo-hydrolase [Photobacterium ganghwense]MBV1841807.1 MBL fold metallo-hydrolase [Photobacterium ganghwense]